MSKEPKIPIPHFLVRQFRNYLLPNETIDNVLDELSYTVTPSGRTSLWSRKKRKIIHKKPKYKAMDIFFPHLYKYWTSDSDSDEADNPEDKKGSTRSSSSKSKNRISIIPNANDDLIECVDTEFSEGYNEMSIFHSTAIGSAHEHKSLFNDNTVNDGSIRNSEGISTSSVNMNPSPVIKHRLAFEVSSSSDTDSKVKDATSSSVKMGISPNIKHKQQEYKKPHKVEVDITSSSESSSETDNVTGIARLGMKVDQIPTIKHLGSLSHGGEKKPYMASKIIIKTESGDNISKGLQNHDNIVEEANEGSDSSVEVSSANGVSDTVTKNPTVQISLWLEQLKNKMKDVKSLSLPEENKFLHAEDITEETELFLIQCPKEVDPSSLQGQKLVLEGESSLMLNMNGEMTRYDSYSSKESLNRSLNLVLPTNDNNITLSLVPLVGNIVLSEAIEVPELTSPEVPLTKRVPFPKSLEKRCLSLPDASMASGESDTSLNRMKRKKERDIFEINSNLEKLKKRKRHNENDTPEDSSFENHPKQKKKKCHSQIGENGIDSAIIPFLNIKQEIDDSFSSHTEEMTTEEDGLDSEMIPLLNIKQEINDSISSATEEMQTEGLHASKDLFTEGHRKKHKKKSRD